MNPKSQSARRSLASSLDPQYQDKTNSRLRSPKLKQIRKLKAYLQPSQQYLSQHDSTSCWQRSKSAQTRSVQRSKNLSRSCSFLPACSKSESKSLPCYTNARHPEFNCITAQTLARLIDNEFKDKIDKYCILDCRYAYEYEGGHVRGATHLPDPQQVKPHFIDNPKTNKRVVIVFYCEFSSQRGPTALRFLRKLDRLENWEKWPRLYYPELYLLDGGYSHFVSTHLHYCEPQGYVSMFDSQHSEDCREAFRRTRKQCAARSITQIDLFADETMEAIEESLSESLVLRDQMDSEMVDGEGVSFSSPQYKSDEGWQRFTLTSDTSHLSSFIGEQRISTSPPNNSYLNTWNL